MSECVAALNQINEINQNKEVFKMRKKSRIRKIFVGLIVGIGILTIGLSGVFSDYFSLYAVELPQLKGPLFQESLKPHPVDPEALEGKIINTVQKISPAVVSISTERTLNVSGYRDRFFSFPEFDEFF